jgi:adenylate cyclase
MSEGLSGLNQSLSHDISEPLRIGIGIHAGPAIVGEMGHGRATSVTAVGDTVNTASRLETLTKEYKCQLVFSEAVATHARLDVSRFERHDIAIRGRLEPLAVRVVADARELPDELSGKAMPHKATAEGPPADAVKTSA